MLEILTVIAALCHLGATSGSANYVNNLQAACQRELLTCMGDPYAMDWEKKLFACVKKRENK